jgi:hypothetical protein
MLVGHLPRVEVVLYVGRHQLGPLYRILGAPAPDG